MNAGKAQLGRRLDALLQSPITLRWWWVAFLTFVGVVEIALIGTLDLSGMHSAAWRLLPSLRAPSPIVYQVLAVGVVGLLMLVAASTLDFKWEHLRVALNFPPVWLAIPAAFALQRMVAVGLSPGANWSSFWTEDAAYVVTMFACGTLLASAAVGLMPRVHPAQEEANANDDWQEWLRTERPRLHNESDRFDRKGIAVRISHHLSRPWGDDRSIALLGPVGCGKTTILNWVEDDLAHLTDPKVWSCRINCWGLEKSESAPAHLLSRALETLQAHVDCLSLRGLPSSYERLLSNDPSGLLPSLLAGVGSAEPLDELRRLTPTLQAVNARLVVFIEDAERSGRGFDPQHVQRLMWGLRDVAGVAFVLAVDNVDLKFDVAKLCDRIESIPPLEAPVMRRFLRDLRRRCLKSHPVRSTLGDAQEDPLHLESSAAIEADPVLDRMFSEGSFRGIADAMPTPRAAKHVARWIEGAWTRLAGEIDLDNVIVASLIRECEPKAFEFLQHHMDALRRTPRVFEAEPERLKGEWEAQIAKSAHAKTLAELVGMLHFERLAPGVARLQGLARSSPNDYFRRLLAEEATEGPPTDQEMMALIDAWLDGSKQPLLSLLLAAQDRADRHVSLCEHFAARFPDDHLLALVEEVIHGEKTRAGRRAQGRVPALLAAWRECTRRGLQGPPHEAWLVDRIVDAVRVSLRLANDLYYYWGARGYAVTASQEGRDAIRRAHVSAVRDHLTSPESLLHVLDEDHHECIARLIAIRRIRRDRLPSWMRPRTGLGLRQSSWERPKPLLR